MEETWDVIIVGGGPAGLTAGIYTARHGLKTLLLERGKMGGRALEAHWIENFPGFPQGLTGHKLMRQFISQAKKFGVKFSREVVIGVNLFDDVHKMVLTRKGFYQTKSIIIATGTQKTKPKIPGEIEFKGRGVSYCAVCDGPFFRNKKIAVLGSSEEAYMEAMHLADFASKVFFIPDANKKPRKLGSIKSKKHDQIELLNNNGKIEIIDNVNVSEICGSEAVNCVRLKGERSNKLEVDGIFILNDHISTTEIIQETGVMIDDTGCIMVDNRQQTNIPGIFAAGDCCCAGMQVITAAGDGGKAALSALRYIKSIKN